MQHGCLKLLHFSKKSGRLSSTGSEILTFGSHCSANFKPILDCFIPKFKLEYDDLENIKTDRVNALEFVFYGHPVELQDYQTENNRSQGPKTWEIKRKVSRAIESPHMVKNSQGKLMKNKKEIPGGYSEHYRQLLRIKDGKTAVEKAAESKVERQFSQISKKEQHSERQENHQRFGEKGNKVNEK